MDGSFFPRRFRSSLFVALSALALPGMASDQSSVWGMLNMPAGGIATRIAMDPATPAEQFLLLPDQGIYRSTDTGGHWDLVAASTTLLDLAMDPLHPHTLYSVDTHNTVSKSTDAGDHWQAVTTGLPVTADGGSQAHLTVDPVDEGTVYLVTWQQGVYKSVDGGGHWSAINTGIDSGGSTDLLQAGASISSLGVDPVDNQVLYLTATSSRDVVTGLPGMALAGVYQSTDGGAHWNQILSGENTWGIGVQPGNDQVLFVSGNSHYFTSIDGGAHWASSATGPVFCSQFLFDPADPQHMWASSPVVGGMTVSIDGGATWDAPNGDDGSTAGVTYLAVDATGTKLYAAWGGAGTGVSDDDGSNWQFTNSGIHDAKISQLMMGRDGTVFLGTEASGLFLSSDGAKTWTASDDGIVSPFTAQVGQLVEDPSGSGIYATIGGRLYRSTDHGGSWSEYLIPLSGGFGALALTAGSPSTVYAAQMDGVEKSADGGASWHLMDTGLPHSAGHAVYALASDPNDAQKVFAGTSRDGLYMSTDGAAHWSRVAGLVIPSSFGSSSVFGLLIDPNDSQTMYATVPMGVVKSTDGGVTWTDASAGLQSNDLLGQIAVDPVDSHVLVARSQINDDVYLSLDAGAQWTLISGATADQAMASGGGSTALIPPLHTLAMDTRGVGYMYGADAKGQLYLINLEQLVTALHQTVTNSGGSSSGGGGTLPLCLDLLLLGALLLRRRG